MTATGRGLAVAAVALLLGSAIVDAQHHLGMPDRMARYDPSTEVSLSGTVQEVRDMDGRLGTRARMGRGMGMMGGIHVVLRTDAEAIEVHLGPVAYLEDQNLVLTAGDRIDVVGSRVTVEGIAAVIARQVSKDGVTVTLRDGQGTPAWSRRSWSR